MADSRSRGYPAPAPSPLRSLETSVRVMAAIPKDGPSRGTALFEEFERVIPYFNRLDERGEFEFIKAIEILLDHFKLSEMEIDRSKAFEAQPIVANLRRLLNTYLQKTMVIPSAIFVVMAYLESSYLEGEDAELVHKLTRLHIERAGSKKQSHNPAGVPQTSTGRSGAPRTEKNSLLAALTSGRRAARVLLRHS